MPAAISRSTLAVTSGLTGVQYAVRAFSTPRTSFAMGTSTRSRIRPRPYTTVMLQGAATPKAFLVAITSFVITVGSMKMLPHHLHSRSDDAITPHSICAYSCSLLLPLQTTTSPNDTEFHVISISFLLLYLFVSSFIAVGCCSFRPLYTSVLHCLYTQSRHPMSALLVILFLWAFE